MTLRDWNELSPAAAEAILLQVCGSQEWAAQVSAQRPFRTMTDFLDAADRNWLALSEPDWFEAFGAHARIGERGESPFSAAEQAGALSAASDVKHALAEANKEYEERFGFIFIVFASGKSPEEMLGILNARLNNDRATEIRNAVAEQMKITRLRLEHMISSDLPS